MMSLALRGRRCGRGVEGVRGKGEAESFPLREKSGGRPLWMQLGARFTFGGTEVVSLC